MSAHWGFLTLPREIRDIIYDNYTFAPDGYHYEHNSGQLRTSKNRPVYLALMCTCKSIADEIHPLKIENNTLHFCTIASPSKSERIKAANFNAYFNRIRTHKWEALKALSQPPFLQYQTPDVVEKVAFKYPQLKYLLRLLQNPGNMTWNGDTAAILGIPESVLSEFTDYVIELLPRDVDFPEDLARTYDQKASESAQAMGAIGSDEAFRSSDSEGASVFRSKYFLSCPEPWSIPSEEDLAQMDSALGSPYRSNNFWERIKWRFSAAAAAVQFFKCASESTLLCARHVVLHEDRLSVARPECHVLGLVPFCAKNTNLRIERRISLWRNAITNIWRTESGYTERYLESLEMMSNNARLCNPKSEGALGIGGSCSRWISEALHVSANGMPPGSFSLIFDGDPDLDQSSKAFEIVKGDAAREEAQILWYKEHRRMPDFLSRRLNGFSRFEGFAEAIRKIINGQSIIRCNFPTGEMYDPKRELEKHRHLVPKRRGASGYVWMNERIRRIRENPLEISAPLPSSLDALVMEDIVGIHNAIP